MQKLKNPPVITAKGSQIALFELADISITDSRPMLRSENTRLSNWVYVELGGRDLKLAVEDMQRAVSQQVKLLDGVSLSWSGQFECLERARAKLRIVLPFTLAIIFVLLYVTFLCVSDVTINNVDITLLINWLSVVALSARK